MRKLHIAGLFDLGNAFDDSLSLREFKPSVGMALRLNWVIGYFVPGAVDVGYARGLATDGIHEWWMLVTSSI